MGPLSSIEILIIVAMLAMNAAFIAIPIVVLYQAAQSRGQNGAAYAWWGLLGFLGMIVGLLILRREQAK